MEKLKGYGRKIVKVEYLNSNGLHSCEDLLTSVTLYNYIVLGVSIGGTVHSFISEYSSIKKIIGEAGEILYENPFLAEDFYPKGDWLLATTEQVFELRKNLFGEDIALRLKADELEQKKAEDKLRKKYLLK